MPTITEVFDSILRESTRSMHQEYVQLRSQDGRNIARERVYCYEFYHQMRKLWDTMHPFNLSLNGELDKRGRLPFFTETPDFLIHTPYAMNNNYCIIEVKPVKVKISKIENDIRTLKHFVDDAGYQRAILLFYGRVQGSSFIRRTQESLQKYQMSNVVEVWHHSQVSEPAVCILSPD